MKKEKRKKKKNKRNRKYMGKEPGQGIWESKNTSHMVKHTAHFLTGTTIRLMMMML
jgi:hypothetical protein